MQSRVKSFVVLWAFVMFMCAYTWADSIPSDPVVDIEQSVFNNGIDPPFLNSAQFTEVATPGFSNSALCTTGTAVVSCNFTSPQFFNIGAPISELEITINTFDAVDAQGNPIEPDDQNQQPWVAGGAEFHVVTQTATSAVFAINPGVSPICTGDGQSTCPFFVSFTGVLIPENGAAVVTIQAVPEPATAFLLAGSLPVFWIRSRRRRVS